MAFGTATGLVAIALRPSPKFQAAAALPSPAIAEVGVAVTSGTIFVNQPGGSRRQVAAGQDIDVTADDALETAAATESQVRLASIANVLLREDTSLLDIATRGGQVDRIRLAHGSVHLKVTKLAADRRFHVVTADADVQVKGTEFDVNLIAEPTPHTCVRVQEGLVQVTTSNAMIKMVAAGETFGCGERAARSTAVAPPAPRPERHARAMAASDLRMQNELFQRALSDEHAGLYTQAGDIYHGLLRRYPTGPLAAQARANLAAMPQER
ncbi:MAG TPA: FecR family protein [Polyangia bacterium]|nr:FecR family protein [Polyangia bacterium]